MKLPMGTNVQSSQNEIGTRQTSEEQILLRTSLIPYQFYYVQTIFKNNARLLL